MMPLLLLFALAGFAFIFSRRRHAAKRQIQPRVIVKGHTFSDCMDDESIQQPQRVQEVRRVCFLGTGGGDISALTALVLADRNPGVQFDVVDRDIRRIAAWNSDYAPVSEPGVDGLLFDDALEVKEEGLYSQELHRKKRLANVGFSTDVAGCVTGADMVFLCDDDVNTIRTIAQVSTGHKIIVQKGRGSIKSTRKKLDKSPTASFDILANPDFLVPGSVIHDLLHPSRVVIGNLPDKHSSEAAALLKGLYAWVPMERILATDVWSAELGRIATNALLAQQSATIHTLSSICSRTDANGAHVSQIVATDSRLAVRAMNGGGMHEDSLRKDVDCLVYLAEELGLSEVAGYWRYVMRINDAMNHRVAHRIVSSLPDRTGMVAMLGFSCREGTASSVAFAQTLIQRGIPVHIYDPYMSREDILTALDSAIGVEVTDGVEKTVSGCSAVVLHTDRGLHEVNWEAVAGYMQPPRFFLDPFRVMGRMEQHGFQMEGQYGRQSISM